MKTTKKLHYLLPALGVIVVLSYLFFGHRHADFSQTPFQHFQDSTGIIHLVIETDIPALMDKTTNPEYQPAKLTLKKNNCLEEHFHLEVKPRGVFRRESCSFPPLKLHFPDEVLTSEELKDYPSLKLVTHCQQNPAFDQLVIKEHLAFKLYNVLTDKSFKTQLARITYCDSKKQYPDEERFGFLIESPKELAERMNGRILGEEFGAPQSIHKPQYKLFTVFQYMIGNTDWGLKNRHNIKLVEPIGGQLALPIPVPYDFDFCGLVDAPYAIPHHTHPISSVRERYFQWYGDKDEEFTDVFAIFREKRTALTTEVNNCPQLDSLNKAEMLNYLSSFFDLLNDPDKIVRN